MPGRSARGGRAGRDLQRQALDEPRISLNDLADAAGVSRSSLERYRARGRYRVRMPARVARRLARYLRQHAKKLLRIADELDRARD